MILDITANEAIYADNKQDTAADKKLNTITDKTIDADKR